MSFLGGSCSWQKGQSVDVVARIVRRIDEVRQERGMTAAAVERSAGLSVSRLSKWRGGDGIPRADQVVRIAAVLGVSPGELLVDPDKPAGDASSLTADQVEVIRAAADRLGYHESLRRLVLKQA